MDPNKRPDDMVRITTPELAQAFIDEQVTAIREQIGDKKVLLALSGGVDSSVVAALLIRAIGKQLICVHVNHGLMRKGESEQVVDVFKNQMDANLVYVDATDRFLDKLAGVADPEAKRKIIGSMFIKVTHDAVSELGIDLDNTFLAQGTLRPDLIESGNPDVSGYANKIKTHHNDVDMVRRARERGLIIETNWDWHKDEVRRVARMLGLDEEIASRRSQDDVVKDQRLEAKDHDTDKRNDKH